MAFQLPLPKRFQRQWTVKIGDREPDPDEVPEALLAAIRRQRVLLCERWDEMYPENPVASEENDDE
jgi:hypothetical protein